VKVSKAQSYPLRISILVDGDLNTDSSAARVNEQKYPVYSVQNKQRRIILNPFKCVSTRNTGPNLSTDSNENERKPIAGQ
jgi:hypothetical protein